MMAKKRDASARQLKKQKALTQSRADGQCEMYKLGAGGGRCARSAATESHHVVSRSQGGGDEPENIAEICNFHHRAIEHRQIERSEWLFQATAPGENAEWSEKKGGEASWILWGNAWQDLLDHAHEIAHECEVAVEIRKQGSWRLVEALHAFEEAGDSWRLVNGIESPAMLASHLGMSVPTLRSYVRISHGLYLFDEPTRERIKALPMSFFLSAKLDKIPAAKLGEILELAEADERHMGEIIKQANELIGALSSKAKGRKRSQVTLIAKAVTFSVEIEHDRAENAAELGARKVERSSMIIDGGVEWATGDEARKVELLKG